MRDRARGSARRRRLRFSTTLICGLVAALLGVIGFSALDLDAPQVVYRTLRLFTLNLDVPEGQDPDVALWIAAFLAPLTTARVLLELLRGRLRAAVSRHLLRGHVIVCGTGVRGQMLVRDHLENGRRVVAVDRDPASAGLTVAAELGAYTVVGDATSPDVLAAAGIARADTVIAVTGDDYTNAAIASAASERSARLFVHLDDPELARMLSGRAIPFSTAAIAASAALDRRGPELLRPDASGRASIAIFGDDPVADAMILEIHRRWQVERLAGVDEHRPPLITLFAPRASERVERLRRRYRAALLDLELVANDFTSDDAPRLDRDALRLLRAAEPLRHTWVIDRREVEGLRLALAVARAVGAAGEVTLLSAVSEGHHVGGVLRDEVAQRASAERTMAPVTPESLVRFGSHAGGLQDARPVARLARALGHGDELEPAERYLDRAGTVVDDPAPIAVHWDGPVLDAMRLPDPAVFVRAGLRVELLSVSAARLAAEKLLAAQDEEAQATAFEYFAHVAVRVEDPRELRELQAAVPGNSPVHALLALRIDVLERRTSPTGETRFAMIAGGAGSWSRDQYDRAAERLRDALEHPVWDGTLISGGTASGISGVVGDLSGVRTRGYAPEHAVEHAGYDEVRHTGGTEFSVAQPLQAWRDLLNDGVHPADVPVLVFPGRRITRQELALAHALGAPVAIIDLDRTGPDSRLDDIYGEATGVLWLPDDGMAIRAFLRGQNEPDLLRDKHEQLAVTAHERYRAAHRGQRPEDDAAMHPWETLSPLFKESNRLQVGHIPEKLAALGLVLTAPGEGFPLSLPAIDPARPFPQPQLERLARMEHGRWLVERARSGWTEGSERRLHRLLTPHLKPWDELDDSAKAGNRRVVVDLPGLLEDNDMEVANAVPAVQP